MVNPAVRKTSTHLCRIMSDWSLRSSSCFVCRYRSTPAFSNSSNERDILPLFPLRLASSTLEADSLSSVNECRIIVNFCNGFWNVKKTSPFKTQWKCKDDISRAFETAKITVFGRVMCKTQHSNILAMWCNVISSFVIFAVLDLRVGGCRSYKAL